MDRNSNLVFSIDPAIHNMALVLFDYKAKQVRFFDVISIGESETKLSTDKIICKIYTLFFKPGGLYTDLIKKSKIVLIEQQMRAVMIQIQNSIGSMCHTNGYNYMFIRPAKVKSFFDTGKAARKAKNESVKGASANYRANKKASIQTLARISPLLFKYIDENTPHIKKKDDVADALLQAVYYAKRYSPT